jgi:hypothetical protein
LKFHRDTHETVRDRTLLRDTPTNPTAGGQQELKMRKSITIAIAAFAAGAVSAWTLSNTDAIARNKVAGAGMMQTIDPMALTRAAGHMPVQQFDAH